MTRRSFLIVTAVVSACRLAQAQQVNDPVGFNSLRGGSAYVPPLALSDARAFPFGSSFAWMQSAPNDFLPSWRPDNWDKALTLAQTAHRSSRTVSSPSGGYSKDLDSSGGNVELRKNLFDYVHGEVGFFYGHSSGGRNSLDSEGGYIQATTGNDKVQISVGGFYENTNVDFGRRGR
jgi:hypothetical protein